MRRNTVRATSALAAMAILALAGANWAGSSSPAGDATAAPEPQPNRGPPPPPGPKLKACPSDGSANFDTYSAGPSVAGKGLAQSLRRCEPLYTGPSAPPGRVNSDTKIYGSCMPEAGSESCSFPVTVESWPACERNLSLYRRHPAPDGSRLAYTTTQIRGTQAAIFDEGTRIEVYTGDATVVVTSTSADLARRAANQLVGNHRGKPVKGDENLPESDPGAVDGTLAC
jgi:hypothetical protein